MNSRFFSQTPDHPLPVAHHGQGVFLFDDQNRKYLDGSSGAMTANLGHCNAEISKTVKEQIDLLTFTYRSQFTNQPLELLCNKIAALAPGSLEMVAFANSGSEAAELALKLAYSYWKSCGKPNKQRMISRWNSYHGSTVGALSMSGNVARRQEYSAYLSDFPRLELPFCHHCPYEKEYPQCNLFCAEYLQRILTQLGEETVSAVICEPVTGASGAGITPPEGYFQKIREICSRNHILLIMDEVITGFGRTGTHFASEHWGIQPDIIVFGKGVSSGLCPLSGIIADRRIYDSLYEKGMSFSTGHTFSGNPLSTAAANGVLDYIEKHDIVRKTGEKGILFKKKLEELKSGCKLIEDVRGIGLLWGIEFSKGGTLFLPEEKLTTKIVSQCFKNGLIVYPSAGFIDGVRGDSILLSPPLVITQEEIELLFALLEKSIREVEGQLAF